MRTLSEVLDQLAFHPGTPEVAEKYAHLRAIAARAAGDSWNLIPDGPEKTTAYRHLQQFLMYANLAVALTTPADLKTPHIARVMPDLPEGATWQCSMCKTSLNDDAVKHYCCPVHTTHGPVCATCAGTFHPNHQIREGGAGAER